MNKEVCKRFKNVREWFPVEMDSTGYYQFKNAEAFQKYCTNECNSNLDKISAGCLYLLNEFFRDSSVFELVAKENFYIVQYILIWLSYILNLIKTQENVNIDSFYNTYIRDGGKYTNNIKYIGRYKGYKDLIDENNYFLSMDMSIIPKLYDAFNTLCDIYNELDANNSNCMKFLEKASKFIEEYEKFIKDHEIAEDKPYLYALITLLDGYDKLKKECKHFPSTPDITKIISGDVSEVTSSSSIASKLIPILSILVAIAIFLGISYKYSLFGFRKRFQKQKLREKLKNIKKKMNQ
ncbi:PIR protein [Plasmodium yoelii yoelii]|uniref:PIR protein n=1 Tax=Plasmodium yoelii yoelii TaxID=73239 RepID=A0AAE9WK52_PLAYO|nr:PIR protein [Plasmodium yoelii yoelii]